MCFVWIHLLKVHSSASIFFFLLFMQTWVSCIRNVIHRQHILWLVVQYLFASFFCSRADTGLQLTIYKLQVYRPNWKIFVTWTEVSASKLVSMLFWNYHFGLGKACPRHPRMYWDWVCWSNLRNHFCIWKLIPGLMQGLSQGLEM